MWIRPMEENDISVIETIEKEIFSDSWSSEIIRQTYNQRLDDTYVAEDNCNIVGYINIRIIDDEAELMRIAVRESYRCRGYASLMMERLMCLATAKSVKIIRLEVRQSNNEAIDLYKRFGFEVCGVRKNYYINPSEDAVLFCKTFC